MRGRRPWILLPLLAAVVAHLRSIGGAFVWDDVVLAERWMATGTNLADLLLGRGAGTVEYYRPLYNLAGLPLFLVAGMDTPWPWHVFNIALHVATTAGVYQLLRRWVPPAPDAAARTIAPHVFGATLFALWPTGVEAVSWIAARTELLLGLFLVWGLVLQLRSRDRGRAAIGAAALHLCALLSKEVGAVFLPLAVVTTALVPAPEGSPDPRPWRSRVPGLFGPHLVVLAVYTLMRRQAMGGGTSSLVALVAERVRPEALGPALLAWGWYVREGLLLGSGSPYVESPAPSALHWGFALAGLLALAFAGDAARRPRDRAWALAGAWFVIALGPSLVFAASPLSVTPVAIRYLYLPSIAVCALVTLGLGRFPERTGARSLATRGLALAAIAIALLAVGWRWQSPWRSDVTLWTRAVEDNPHSSVARFNLGLALIAARDVAAGEEQLRRAASNPRASTTRRQSMLVRLGEYYVVTHQNERAAQAFASAQDLGGSPANTARAAAGAASLLLLDSATLTRETAARQIAILEEVAALDIHDVATRLLLARLQEALGEPVPAIVRYEEIAEVSFGRPEERASALASATRLRDSIANEPDPVRRLYFQAQLFERGGEPARALAALDEASRLGPENASIWFSLGIAQQRSGNAPAAAASFGQCIRIAPAWWKPYPPRAFALEAAGDTRGAIAAYESFLLLPDAPPGVREEASRRLARLRSLP